MKLNKVLTVVLCLAMLVGILAGCEVAAPTTSSSDESKAASSAAAATKLKVGVIYISPKDDGGWSQAHANGFKEAISIIGSDKVEISELENISDLDAAKTETAIRQLIDGGCKIIFTTSFGYMETTKRLATEFPNVKFEHCSGTESNATNFDNYFGQIEQPRYLTGIMAGYATKSNKIGYVAAHPFPEVIRGINAFTMGVRSVNPKAQVYVEWTRSWFDPTKEKENAIALLNKGCDVMAQHQDSTAALAAAEEKGVFAIGYDNPMGQFAPKGYLSAPIFKWGAYYEKKITAMLDNTWKVEKSWGGMKEGIVDIDTMSANVSATAKAKVEEMKTKLLAEGNNFIFKGPIKDNKGAIAVAEGKTLTREEQYSMMWLAEGVVGEAK
jgi:basic membrane protein A